MSQIERSQKKWRNNVWSLFGKSELSPSFYQRVIFPAKVPRNPLGVLLRALKDNQMSVLAENFF